MRPEKLCCFVFVLLALTGCGQTPTSYLVQGTVKVNGEPAEGVYVVLHAPGSQAAVASARSLPDGQFVCEVERPGDYPVTLMWPRVTVTKEETIEGPDRFRGKYGSPGKAVTTILVTDSQPAVAEISVVTGTRK